MSEDNKFQVAPSKKMKDQIIEITKKVMGGKSLEPVDKALLTLIIHTEGMNETECADFIEAYYKKGKTDRDLLLTAKKVYSTYKW